MILINLANLLTEIYNSDGLVDASTNINIVYFMWRVGPQFGRVSQYMVLMKQQRKCIYHYRHT